MWLGEKFWGMGFGEEVEGETFPAAGDEGTVEGPEVFFFWFFFLIFLIFFLFFFCFWHCVCVCGKLGWVFWGLGSNLWVGFDLMMKMSDVVAAYLASCGEAYLT